MSPGVILGDCSSAVISDELNLSLEERQGQLFQSGLPTLLGGFLITCHYLFFYIALSTLDCAQYFLSVSRAIISYAVCSRQSKTATFAVQSQFLLTFRSTENSLCDKKHNDKMFVIMKKKMDTQVDFCKGLVR